MSYGNMRPSRNRGSVRAAARRERLVNDAEARRMVAEARRDDPNARRGGLRGWVDRLLGRGAA